MMKYLNLFTCSGLALLLPLTLAAAADKPRKAPPATVEVATAASVKLAPTRWVPGSVVSRDDAKIASGTAGRVVFVAEVGARIAAGAPVARLDDAALKLRLDEARAERAHAQAQQELATHQWDRLSRLAPTNSIAATQLDEARATRDGAQHELARLDARMHGIERELTECEVRAPFAGVVTERFVQRGEWVQTGAAIAHLVDTEHLELKVLAPLVLAGNVRAGSALTIRGNGAEQRGNVRAVVPVGDERSRQFELRLALPGSYALVGTALEAELPEARADEALTVPRDALVLRQDRTYVMRVKSDNTAERVEVKPGATHESRVAVSGALAAGDRVVVRGAERLEPGQSVIVVSGSG
jgi:RND family efflux transporter MFP subunit